MPHNPIIRSAPVSLAVLAAPALAQVIDFETLPGGAVPADQLVIDTQYAADFGVTFSLLDRTTGAVIGAPQIAKPGSPRTAFDACPGPDTPIAGQGLGSSFLTDGSGLGVNGDLFISYASPVAAATGVIIDTDCRSPNGSLPCEQWTVEALDGMGTVIDTFVIDAPTGPGVPPCISGNGPGDARAAGWFFNRPQADIFAVRIRYTGAATDVGLAFDNFSVSTEPGALEVVTTGPDPVCAGEFIVLEADASGGLPPYQYEWTLDDGNGPVTIGTTATIELPVYASGIANVIITDALAGQLVSPDIPVEVGAVTYVLSQESAAGAGDFAANVLAELTHHLTADTAAGYYGFSGNGDNFAGAHPAIVPDAAHTMLLGSADGVGLLHVYNAPGGASGRAESRLVFDDPMPGAGWIIRDDSTDGYAVAADQTFRANHSWAAGFTDGVVIGPLTGSWGATFAFADTFAASPTIENITEWAAFDGDPNEPPIPLALTEDRRIRIARRCALDCVADVNTTNTNPGDPAYGMPDGTVDGADLSFFVENWLAGILAVADVNTTNTNPGDPGYGSPDGVVDGADLSYFVENWLAGCQ